MQEMAQLRFLPLLRICESSASYLESIISVFFLGLDLSYLTPVELNDRDWMNLSPFVKERSHSHFITQDAASKRLPASGVRPLDIELSIDLLLNRTKALSQLLLFSGKTPQSYLRLR